MLQSQREIEPCFIEKDGRRTDRVVLACTHFPLLIDELERLAPWPVTFVDPAPRSRDGSIRCSAPPDLRRPPIELGPSIFTSGMAPQPSLQKALLRYGLKFTPTAAIRLALAERTA